MQKFSLLAEIQFRLFLIYLCNNLAMSAYKNNEYKKRKLYNKLVSFTNGLTVDEACSQNRVTEKIYTSKIWSTNLIEGIALLFPLKFVKVVQCRGHKHIQKFVDIHSFYGLYFGVFFRYIVTIV